MDKSDFSIKWAGCGLFWFVFMVAIVWLQIANFTWIDVSMIGYDRVTVGTEKDYYLEIKAVAEKDNQTFEFEHNPSIFEGIRITKITATLNGEPANNCHFYRDLNTVRKCEFHMNTGDIVKIRLDFEPFDDGIEVFDLNMWANGKEVNLSHSWVMNVFPAKKN